MSTLLVNRHGVRFSILSLWCFTLTYVSMPSRIHFASSTFCGVNHISSVKMRLLSTQLSNVKLSLAWQRIRPAFIRLLRMLLRIYDLPEFDGPVMCRAFFFCMFSAPTNPGSVIIWPIAVCVFCVDLGSSFHRMCIFPLRMVHGRCQ